MKSKPTDGEAQAAKDAAALRTKVERHKRDALNEGEHRIRCEDEGVD